ncbi:MAG TPA: glycoside hydrolase family 15 protein [Longimicrobiales bacterium]|nr:glycoside hydrolase family 15 protein [Longimicrobiales bacterium]
MIPGAEPDASQRRRQTRASRGPAFSHPIPRYQPIGDYGVIGDGRSIALVSSTGSVDWWCLPRFDGDPVFGRILDADLGGSFVIRPVDAFTTTRRYLQGTNVLETEFTTASGIVRVTDFMPALTESQKHEYPVPYREIVRRIEGASGRVHIEIRVDARPGYGRTTPRVRQRRPTRFTIEWGNQALHLASSAPLGTDQGAVTGRIVVSAGERFDLALAYSPEAPADLPVLDNLEVIQRLTEQFWREWSSRCWYAGPYRDAVIRSALALKLLTYAPSGAVIAAPTTSLPEEIGGVRNWDYRYCWLRDAAFTIRALLRLGYEREAHAFAEWLLYTTRVTHPEFQALYTAFGGADIPEKILPHLEGYRGSSPVRTGNAAAAQFQLDVYGEVIDALTLYRRSGGTFDRDARRLLRGMGRIVMERWREPDEGIWEVRSGRAQHVHSKVMAWLGLERLLELATFDPLPIRVDEIRRTRDAIRAWVLDHGYDPRLGSFTRTPGHELDAALLRIPLTSLIDGTDPRIIGTVDAIRTHLARGELVYRYLGPDGLPPGEGAFVVCSFWLVEALAHIGRVDAALEYFERLLDRRSDLGLLAEEIDPETGEARGNFPQALSHVGLINAALTIAERSRAARHER